MRQDFDNHDTSVLLPLPTNDCAHDDRERRRDEEDDRSSSSASSKRPTRQSSQALFLNFTADLSAQITTRKKDKPKKQAAYKVNGVNILNRYYT